MIDRLTHAAEVVNHYTRQARPNGSPVHCDQRNTMMNQRLDRFRFNLRGEQSDTIHLTNQHASNRLLHSRNVQVGCGEKHVLAVVGEDALEAADELGKERIGDVRDDEAVARAAAILQGGGAAVGYEPRLFNDLAHACGGLGSYHARTVDYVRDGGARDAGELRDVTHVHWSSL